MQLRALVALSLLGTLAACGRHRDDIVVASAPPPYLAIRADQEAHASAPQGERVGDPLLGVAYQSDQATQFRIPLEAGNCYFFGYASEPTIEKLTFYVFDPRERRIETVRQRPEQGVFRRCAAENGVFRVEGKVGSGAGHFAVALYKTSSAPVVAIAAAVPSPAPAPPPPSADLPAAIERQALSAAPGARRVGELFSGMAESTEWVTALEAGKCYWFIGAGEPGSVRKLSLYLWDPRNKRIGENHSETETAMVGHCPTYSGMYKIEAKVSRGAGQYKLGVYVK